MVSPTTSALQGAFASIVDQAWAISPVVVNTATNEPNHVARLVHGTPTPMVAAIKTALPFATFVSVAGVFCHTSPFVFWGDAGSLLKRRELADLMVNVEVHSPAGITARALLVQVKMGKKGTQWASPMALTGLEPGQRELYANLPQFLLEKSINGDPSKQHFNKNRLVVAGAPAPYRPYDLNPVFSRQALKAQPVNAQCPCGLVYAAVNPSRPANGTLLSGPSNIPPWLVEDAKATVSSISTGRGTFNQDLAHVIAEMVGEPPGASLKYGPDVNKASPPDDWTRLVDDLMSLALKRDKTIWNGTTKKALGVHLNSTAAPNGVLVNVQTFAVRDDRLLSMWSHASSAPVRAAGAAGQSGLPDWVQERLVRDGTGFAQPPLDDLGLLRVSRGGFGMLTIRVNTPDQS